MGKGNHNYGKTFSGDHKKKMSNSIRDSKNGVSDETIKTVREMINSGKKNIEIQESMNLPRHTVTRIKNGNLVCRDEEKLEKAQLSQTEINISKRKIEPEEIIIVVKHISQGKSPKEILQILINRRKKYYLENTITIDIIKNIKRNIKNNKPVLYSSEVNPVRFFYFNTLLDMCNGMV
jgi:hypothetical protein